MNASIPTIPTEEISVIDPINRALDRAKLILFQPFDLSRWFLIGFCAWLARLGESGASFNFHLPSRHTERGAEVRMQLEHFKTYVLDHLDWIVPLGIVLVVLSLALWVLLLWLNSRGKFMFLYCVALNRAEIEGPWKLFAREANSLFRFQLVLGLVGSVVMLPLMVLLVLVVYGMINRNHATLESIMAAAGLLLFLIGAGIAYIIVRKLTVDFVVPLMYLRRSRCRAAWREFLGLISIDLVLYLLFQIVIALATIVLIVLAVICTCCIAGCFMIIPYLGTVLLLPVLVFQRSYSLYFLAQYGPSYDVFTAPAPQPV